MQFTDFSQIHFHHDDWGQLTVTLPDGTVHHDVEPVRCFPWTSPQESIALVGSDGHEITNIPTLTALSPEARAMLERDLSQREFVPKISRITKSSGPWPPCTWNVLTDRGETVVKIDSEDDVRKIGQRGALVADSDGVRFLIPDTAQLDATSLRHLRRLL